MIDQRTTGGGMMELLNCPFCGSDDLAITQCYVYCNDCGGIGPSDEPKDKTIKAWNTRTLEVMPESLWELWLLKQRMKRGTPPEDG
jgi:Lar family restriction alleviation protein